MMTVSKRDVRNIQISTRSQIILHGYRSMSNLMMLEQAKALHGETLLMQSASSKAKYGTSHSIAGYINNVHAFVHLVTYHTVEMLVDSLLPLFNPTLIDLKAPG